MLSTDYACGHVSTYSVKVFFSFQIFSFHLNLKLLPFMFYYPLRQKHWNFAPMFSYRLVILSMMFLFQGSNSFDQCVLDDEFHRAYWRCIFECPDWRNHWDTSLYHSLYVLTKVWKSTYICGRILFLWRMCSTVNSIWILRRYCDL